MLQKIDNQPVVFEQDWGTCPLGTGEYAQFISKTDITQFQLKNQPCPLYEQSVVSFDTLPSQWTYGSGWARDGINATFTPVDSGTLSQSTVFVVGRYYLLEIVVDELTIGESRDTGFIVSDGVTDHGTFNAVGTHRFWFFATGENLEIRPDQGFASCTIQTPSVIQYATDLVVAIFQNDGTYVDKLTPWDDPDSFAYNDDVITVSVQWNSISITAGNCYYLCVMDECTNTCGQVAVPNGNFADSNTFWTVHTNTNATATYLKFGAGLLVVPASTPGAVLYRLTHDQMTLCDGLAYTFTMTVSAISGIWNVTAYAGTASATVAAGGVGTITINVTCSGGTDFGFQVQKNTSAATDTITITDVRIELQDPNDYTCDLQSNDFRYIGASECSILINAFNDNDAFGLRFQDNNFSPRIRIGGRMVPSDMPYMSERKSLMTSDGNRKTYYFRTTKRWALTFHNEPPFIMDFIRLLAGMDYVYVDDQLVSIENDEFPDISWNRTRTLGKFTLEIAERKQDIVKRKTASITSGGYPLAGFLALESGELMLLNTDGYIEINLK